MTLSKHKATKLFKQLTSLILASLMVLSTFSTAFALGGSAHGNDTSGVPVGYGGDFSALVTGTRKSGKIGVRLSLVNRSNPSEVISVGYDENGKLVHQVVDLLYVTPEAFDYQISGQYLSKLYPEYSYNSVKTQGLSSLASNPDQQIKQVFYPEICTWANSDNNMPPWLGYEAGKFVSAGSDFVYWCQSDDNGNLVLGEGHTVYTTNIYGQLVALQVNKAVDNKEIYYTPIEGNVGAESISIDNDEGQGLMGTIEAYRSGVEVLARECEQDNIKPGDVSEVLSWQLAAQAALTAIDKDSEEYNKAISLFKDVESKYNELIKKEPRLLGFGGTLSKQDAGRISLVASLGKNAGSTLYKNMIDYFSSNFSNAGGASAATGDAVLKTHLHTIIEKGIPDTSKPKNADGSYPLLLNEHGNPIHYLNTESTLTEGLSLDKSKEDWALLIEPLMWLTIFPANDDKRPAIHTKIYGTISNIADAFCIEPELIPHSTKKRSTFNWKAFEPAWGALTVGDEGYNFRDSNGNILLNLEQPVDVGTELPFSELHAMNTTHIISGLDPETNAQIVYPQRIGYGVNVYDKNAVYGDGDGSMIDTWDKEKYPTGTPGPAPDATDETNYPKETEFGDKSKKFNIVKWYTVVYTDKDGTEKEMVVDVKTRKNTPHTVVIENEYDKSNDYMWEVKKWATGKESITPRDGDTSTTFEQYHKKNPSTSKKVGICPDILQMEPEEEDSILYVKLTAQKILKREDNPLTIIKVKDHQDGTTSVETIPGAPIDNKYNAEEKGWDYLEDTQNPNEATNVTTWQDVPKTGTPGATPDITVAPNTKTIYVHYQEGANIPLGKKPLVLHQNELSHGYTLKNLHTDGALSYIQEKFASKDKPINECPGHEEWSDRHEEYRYHRGSTRKPVIDEDNQTYRLSVTSGNNNPNFITDYSQEGDSWTHFGYMGISGGYTDNLHPNASFLLYRNKDRDLVTLYPNKNDTQTQGLLEHIGIGATGSTPQTTRIATTGSGKFHDTFKHQFSEAEDYDRTLGWVWYCTYSGDIEGTGTWDSTFVAGHSLSDLNNSYNFDNNIETRYELGTTGQGTTEPTKTVAQDFAGVFQNNNFISVKKDGDIQFYPYIKMQYNDVQNDSNNRKDIYVTSTNTSTVSAFTKVEGGVWKNSQRDTTTMDGNNPDPNVQLESTQWSTHRNSINFLGEIHANDKKSVLPGGAIFDVSMKPDTSEWNGPSNDVPTTSTKIGYRIWQTCIDDSKTGLLAPGSTAPTVSEAKESVNKFDSSVKEAIPTYGLVQTVLKGAVDYRGYLGSYLNSPYTAVISGGTWNSTALSTDAKYYLKLLDNKGDGQEFSTTVSNFDIMKGGPIFQQLYTIGSDTQGDVYVQRDGTEIGRIHATESIETLLSQSQDIKLLDTSTKAVTNYVKSIDRNRGQDPNSKPWYNEAFDGINVLYTYLSYDIGFGKGLSGSPGANGNGTTVRSAVLDPKLTGRLDSKSDFYNFSPETQAEKIRSSMFLTGQTGKSDGLANPTGKIGTLSLKNGTTIQAQLSDMREFAFSKLFYIPNANVTDLN